MAEPSLDWIITRKIASVNFHSFKNSFKSYFIQILVKSLEGNSVISHTQSDSIALQVSRNTNFLRKTSLNKATLLKRIEPNQDKVKSKAFTLIQILVKFLEDRSAISHTVGTVFQDF